jgi:hypothetical protein
VKKDFRFDNYSKLIVLAFCIFAITNPLNAQWVRTGRPGAGLTFALAGNDTDLIAGTFGGGVFLSTDNGASWNARNNGLTDLNVFALAVNGTDLYLGMGGGVRFSNSSGESWTTLNNGLTSTFVVSLAIVPNGVGGSNFLAATNGGGVFLSSNNGANWSAVNNGLPNTFVHVLAVTSGASGPTLFVGVDQGGVYLSTDNGASWNAVNTGLPAHASIFTLVSNGTNVFAGIDNGRVFRSSNNGANWTEADSGLSGATVSMLTFGPNGNGTDLFAAMSSGGVFHSTNDGTSWTAVNTGLTNTDIRTLSFFPASGPGANIFAVNFNGDIWKRPVSEIVTSLESPETDLPVQFNLEQNYPNPFNPSTKIGFGVQGSGFVSLKVYNVLGREVATLVNEKKVAGEYSVNWNASSMSSGVYFYRLQVGSFAETKKLILLR